MNRLTYSVFVFLLAASSLSAQSIFDLLPPGDHPTEVSLTVNFSALDGTKDDKAPATFRLEDTVGTTSPASFSLKVTPRGRYRRANCAFAPLKLDFKKAELSAAGLAEYDKYKLVVPCVRGVTGERLIRKEFLAYEIYQQLTPFSYRVRLLEVTLKDAAGKDKDRTHLAYLIESHQQLADRTMTMRSTMPFGLSAEDFLPTAEVTHALFQYLIGNTDYDLIISRNVKAFANDSGLLIPVGYDFDFSAWVNAPYAIPRREVGQRSLKQRVYLGHDRMQDALLASIDRFEEARSGIEEAITTSSLSRWERQRLLGLVEGFYLELPEIMVGG